MDKILLWKNSVRKNGYKCNRCGNILMDGNRLSGCRKRKGTSPDYIIDCHVCGHAAAKLVIYSPDTEYMQEKQETDR